METIIIFYITFSHALSFPSQAMTLKREEASWDTLWWLTIAGFYWTETQNKAEVSLHTAEAELTPQPLLCIGQCLVMQTPPWQPTGVIAEHE